MSLSQDDIKELNRLINSVLLKNQVKVSRHWRNFMHNQQQHDAVVLDIQNREALQTLMKFLHARNQKKSADERIVVRAAAGGRKDIRNSESYSATGIVKADIIIRLTGPDFTLVQPQKDHVVRVGGSMQIGELDEYLYEKLGMVMPTSSLMPYVTVAGLSATGGHGTGRDQPSFAGLVKGMTLCTETGNIVHIDESHQDFEAIRAAHNGMYGIVLNMDIQCMPARKLQCVMERRGIPELKDEIRKGLLNDNEYVSIMLVPTYSDNEANNASIENVLIYRWKPVPLDTPNTNHTPVLDNFLQKIQGEVGNLVNIPEILRTYPDITPYYMRYAVRPFAIGNKDELSTGPWHEQAHYRSDFPTDFTEICGLFPVKDTQRPQEHGEEIIRAIDKTMELLEKHKQRGEYPLTFGLYFRYMQGTQGGLSITEHKDGYHICALDLATNERIPGFIEFEREMQEFFINELNGKLHWGKDATEDLNYQAMFGTGWSDTKAALEKWHQENNIDTAKSMLLNPYMSKVLDYPPPSLKDEPALLPQPKPYITAIGARELLNLVGDQSEHCKCLRDNINADIQKFHTPSSGSVFKPSHPIDDVVGAVDDLKKCCTIL